MLQHPGTCTHHDGADRNVLVFSCVLSLSPADLAAAKEQNISILSYLANHFNAPIIAWMAPIIAIIAITKSFLGHYLGRT
ncbi:serine transporter [Enterobacter cloacae]|uniref:Serine transporter n=1 Tax=Enterobacter cloacae TaxID=550 RepID=A0A377LT70_ENTCL|nr:serine transporter [Enterobacter cloacae]